MDRAFEVVENELFAHNGMWRLKPHPQAVPPSAIILVASASVGRMSALLLELARTMQPNGLVQLVGDANEIFQSLGRVSSEVRQILGLKDFTRNQPGLTLPDALARCEEAGRSVIAVVDIGAAKLNLDWWSEGAGMFAAEPDVVAVGGQVLRPNGEVAWRGGFRGFGGMAGSPDYGRAHSDSGYHGMGWCQRLCDSVPSVCFFAKIELLREAVAELGDCPLILRELAGQVAQAAWRADQRIIYTPFVQVTLSQDCGVFPILPSNGHRLERARPAYYPAAFGSTHQTSYRFPPDRQA